MARVTSSASTTATQLRQSTSLPGIDKKRYKVTRGLVSCRGAVNHRMLREDGAFVSRLAGVRIRRRQRMALRASSSFTASARVQVAVSPGLRNVEVFHYLGLFFVVAICTTPGGHARYGR